MQAAGVSAAGRPASWLETRHSHTETVYGLCMLLRERYLAPKVKTRRALTRKAASSAAAVPADVTLMLPDDLLLMLVRCAAATTLTGTLSTAPQLHRPRRHPHESHHIRLRPRRHPHRLRGLRRLRTFPTSASAASDVARCGLAETALSMERVRGRHPTLTLTLT